MLDLLLLGFVVAGAYCLGAAIVRSTGLADKSTVAFGVLATASGMASLALGVLLLGAVHMLWTWTIWLLVAAPLFLRVALIKGSPVDCVRSRWESLRSEGSRLTRLEAALGLIIIIGVAYHLAAAYAPPVQLDQSYRLDVAKNYATAHRIVRLPYIPQSALPSFVEMLYTAAILLHGPALANLIHCTMGILILAAVYGFARRRWGRPGALAASAVIAVGPTFGWLAGVAYSDLASALYQVLALLLTLEWIETDRGGLLIAAGAMAGLALGIDHGALITVAFIALAVVGKRSYVELIGDRPGNTPVEVTVVIGAAAALPWYLHGWWASGSPVFPYFADMLYRPDIAAMFRQATQPAAAELSLQSLLKLPWTLTMSAAKSGAVFGPALLAVLPAALWIEKWPVTAKMLALYLAFYTFFCLVTSPHSMFLAPAFAASALLLGWSFDTLTKGQQSLLLRRGYSMTLVGLLAIALVDGGVSAGEPHGETWTRAVVGLHRLDPKTYLSAGLGGAWDVIRYANVNLPKRAKLFAVNEKRGYYSEREFLCGDYTGIFTPACKPKDRYGRLRALGVTHILHVAKPGSAQTQTIQADLGVGRLVLVFASRGVQLFAIARKQPSWDAKPPASREPGPGTAPGMPQAPGMPGSSGMMGGPR